MLLDKVELGFYLYQCNDSQYKLVNHTFYLSQLHFNPNIIGEEFRLFRLILNLLVNQSK